MEQPRNRYFEERFTKKCPHCGSRETRTGFSCGTSPSIEDVDQPHSQGLLCKRLINDRGSKNLIIRTVEREGVLTGSLLDEILSLKAFVRSVGGKADYDRFTNILSIRFYGRYLWRYNHLAGLITNTKLHGVWTPCTLDEFFFFMKEESKKRQEVRKVVKDEKKERERRKKERDASLFG